MLQTWIHHIKPGKEDRLRAWLGELNTRADEVRASFAAAGVRAEQAFVVPGAAGSLLLYVSETDHPDHAEQVFENSTRTIDIEHRAVMEECIEDTLNDAPNYDVGW